MDDPRATIRLEPDGPVERPPTETLQLGDLLGEGAMGQVVAAWQPGLSRSVAVKRPRPGSPPQIAAHLRLEARATGLLEHPNIVPVHDLREGGDGPWMVMKHISGDLWDDLIDEPKRCVPYLEGRDVLELHLGVLIAVCRALAFAHERGVVHRDVKPSNVMIGRFGEVYLLDWGIAVALREGVGLPLAVEQRRVAGSPAFMAPEMARGDGPAITERTDVYLVGAVLYYVLTGRPYHAGETVQEALAHAKAGTRRTPRGVPQELAQLVMQCTHPDPAWRPSCIDDVRQALDAFLRHRGAAKVVVEAERRMLELKGLVDDAVAGASPDPAIRQLAAEARFGYRQGLEQWPEHQRARDGLAMLLRVLVRYELLRENADAAAGLIDELGGDEELERQLDALRDQLAVQARAAEELEAFRQDQAPALSAGTRMVLGAFLGLFTAAMLFGMGWWDRTTGIAWREVLIGVTLFSTAASTGCLVMVLRPNNLFGRSHALVTASIAIAVWLHWICCWALGMTVHAGMTLSGLLASAILVVAGLLHDRMVVPAGVVYGLSVPLLLLFPDHLFEVFGVINGASFFTYAAMSHKSGRSTA